MDAGMMNLLISLVSGAVGGNVGGAVGGLATLGQAGNIGSSAVIGALLPLVVGMLKKKA
jgi:hypothetical protein